MSELARFDKEPEAWAFLGKLFDSPSLIQMESGKTPCIWPASKDDHPVFGLCRAVVSLEKRVPSSVYARMQKRLSRYLQKMGWDGTYLFPLTLDGMKQRGAACLLFSSESEKGY